MSDPVKMGTMFPALPIPVPTSHHDHGHDKEHEIMSSAVAEDNHDHDAQPLVFDPISQAIHSDPLFITAVDEWGAFPQALWKACDRLGIERVRDMIIMVRKKGGLNNKSAYLFKCLKSAQ